MSFFPKRKTVSSRYQNAEFCGEYRYAITITNISVAM